MKNRRGTAGTFFAYKLVGSYATPDKSLDEIIAFGEDLATRIRTIAMATKPGTSPVTGKPMFELKDDEVEIGLGVHGEAAAHTLKMADAKTLARVMVDDLLADCDFKGGEEVSVLVNGMGQTTYMEKCIFYKEVHEYLTEKGVNIFKVFIGDYITTQEMAGLSLSFCIMNDELKTLLLKETDAQVFRGLDDTQRSKGAY